MPSIRREPFCGRRGASLVCSRLLRLSRRFLRAVEGGGPVRAYEIDANENNSTCESIPKKLPVISACRGAGGLKPSAAKIAEEISKSANQKCEEGLCAVSHGRVNLAFYVDLARNEKECKTGAMQENSQNHTGNGVDCPK